MSTESQALAADRAAVRMVDVWKTYEMGAVAVHALRGVNLDVPRGEFITLLGPSGSGKTTLLNLVGGLDTPTRGRILVGQQDIGGYDEARLTEYRRSSVGFVFQFFNLIPSLTARENVELVGELVGRAEAVDSVLEEAGLSDRSSHFPSELSGGEQQRVAIARALVKRPRLLLADEPTGNLDFETALRLLRTLRDVCSDGRSILIATHNSAISLMADLVIRLRSGEVVETKVNPQPAEPESLRW